MKAIIYDTETTGKNNPEVIEAAWLPFDIELPFPEMDEHFVERFKPEGEISYGAMAVHHIHISELQDCPPSSSLALPGGIDYLIGHSVDFDWRVSGEPDLRRVCTLALARKYLPEMDDHSQTALLYKFFGKDAKSMSKNAHSALADVGNCWHMLKALIRHIRVEHGIMIIDMDDLWALSEDARTPSVMPFGKHKGVKISDIPVDYKDWLKGKDDIDPYLKKALESH